MWTVSLERGYRGMSDSMSADTLYTTYFSDLPRTTFDRLLVSRPEQWDRAQARSFAPRLKSEGSRSQASDRTCNIPCSSLPALPPKLLRA